MNRIYFYNMRLILWSWTSRKLYKTIYKTDCLPKPWRIHLSYCCLFGVDRVDKECECGCSLYGGQDVCQSGISSSSAIYQKQQVHKGRNTIVMQAWQTTHGKLHTWLADHTYYSPLHNFSVPVMSEQVLIPWNTSRHLTLTSQINPFQC